MGSRGLYKGLISGAVKGAQKGVLSGLGKGLYNDFSARGKLDVFGIIGDSILAGGAADRSALPPFSNAAEWYQGALIPVGTSTSVGPLAVTARSPWPKFCADYFAATGRIAVIVNMARSSSTISTASDNNDWQTTGINYNPFITEMRACLNFIGAPKPLAIFTNLGINDVQGVAGTGGQTVAQITVSYQTVLTNLFNAFPGVPVVQCQIGQTTLIPTSARLQGVRSAIKNLTISNTLFTFGASLSAYASGGLYQDGIHPNKEGNDYLGAMFCRWVTHSSYTKYTRSLIACHFVNPTIAYKTALETWMVNNQPRLQRMDFCYNFKEFSRLDCLWDYAFLSSPTIDGGFTFTLNDSIRTASSTFFDTGQLQLDGTQNGQRNDWASEVFVKTNHSGSGVTGFVHGIFDTGLINGTGLGQDNNGPNIIWSTNKAALSSNLTHTHVDPGSWILLRSTSTAHGIDFNGAVLQSGSTSSVAFRNQLQQLGRAVVNGVGANNVDVSLTRYMAMTFTHIGNRNDFRNEFNTFQAAY